ncbi:CdiA family toxin C-terminal domain-containing protein [Pseudomonas anuradhapurensis]
MDAQKSDADASFLDVYALSGSDWSPMGVVANRYVKAIRKSELFAEWRGQGLSEEAIIERARQDGLLGSTLAPVDVPGIISLVDKGASRDDVVKFAAVLILGKATSCAKGTATAGEQAASTLPKNFNESVLGHNAQIGVRNSKAGTISGAHNNDAFMESVEITGAKISNKITDSRFPGVVEYSYRLPRTNTKGELIGGYKSLSTKPTYDSKVLSDSKVADMSSRAAVQTESVFQTNPALREASIKIHGYYFQVTRNSKTGKITNSFITMPPRTN